MEPYQLLVTYQCRPGGREAFLRSIVEKGILTKIRCDAGCIYYDFYLSVQDENRLLLMESWIDKMHQQAHCAQEYMNDFQDEKKKYIVSTEVKLMEAKDVI